MVQVFGGRHIGDAFAVVGKAASSEVAVFGHTLKRPGIVYVVIDPGKKHFNASIGTAETRIQFDVFGLQHLEDFQAEFIDIQLETCLDGCRFVRFLDIFGYFFKALFDLLVSLPDDLLVMAYELGQLAKIMRGKVDPEWPVPGVIGTAHSDV